MPARTFERGIEDIERAERSNISTQGIGAVPYGMSEPVFNFMGQAPGQSFLGAYGQTGQPQTWNPYAQQQQPWNVYPQNVGLPWSLYGQQPFGHMPYAQFGQPNVFANPYVNPYAQLGLYGQFPQQPVLPFTQQPFFPFAQSAVHPLAQQQFNPFAQQQFNPLAQQFLPVSQLAQQLQQQQQQNPFVQQPVNPIAQQFAHPFGSLGFYSGSGQQTQQTLPFNMPISQQIPGIYGQHLASTIQHNPLFQSTPAAYQSPFFQFTNPLSQFGFTQQYPWSQIAPSQYSQIARFAQSPIPERQGFGQTGEFGRMTGSQSQTLARAPKGYKRPDDRIKDDIIERLISYPLIDASEMDIVVKDGEVTLRGSVEDRNVKRIGEEIAESVFGVRDVLNELRVNPKFMQSGAKEREQELTGAARGKEK